MDFLIELILDLILEGSIELSSNKKVPKWIRYILIAFIILFFVSVCLLLLLVDLFILKENILIGVGVLILIIIFIFFGIRKVKIIYFEKKN